MEQLRQVISAMIECTSGELDQLLLAATTRTFRKQEILSHPGVTPNEIFFITSGLVRVTISDRDGREHTLHFALENQFIADYSCFMQRVPALYTLQALEPTQVIVMPRQSIEWGYRHMKEGNKLGRLIAEYYFIYQDNRIKNSYARSPKERYDSITEVFPGIHNRVPQHMIASYLGITPVHLSRLKKGG